MLAVHRTGHFGASGCAANVPTMEDEAGNTVRLPHRRIEACLDTAWSRCGECLPELLAEILVTPALLDRKESDAAVEIAFRVILELGKIQEVTSQAQVGQIEEARRRAAEILAYGEMYGGYQDLARYRPEWSLIKALEDLRTEYDPVVATLMVKILGTLPTKMTDLALIDEAVLVIDSVLNRGILDLEQRQAALRARKFLVEERGSRIVPPAPPVPTPPVPVPTPPVPVPTPPVPVPHWRPPRVAPWIIGGVAVGIGLGVLAYLTVRDGRPPRLRRRPAVA